MDEIKLMTFTVNVKKFYYDSVSYQKIQASAVKLFEGTTGPGFIITPELPKNEQPP